MLELVNTGVKVCKRAHMQAPPVRLWYFNHSSLAASLMKEIGRLDIPVTFLEGEESLVSIYEKGLADLVFFYDLGQTPYMQVLQNMGVGSVSLGSNPISLACMASTGPLGTEPLRRETLRGAHMIIPINTYYDEMSCALSALFGDDLDLRFTLRTDLAHSAIKYRDLREGVFASGTSYVASALGSRDDIVIHTTIDGKPIMGQMRVYYRQKHANPNIHAILECIQKLNKEPAMTSPPRPFAYNRENGYNMGVSPRATFASTLQEPAPSPAFP